MFEIIQQIPEKSLLNFLMKWLDSYTTKRFSQLKQQITLAEKFECCGKTMLTVIMKGKSACVMPELGYNRIIETEQKFRRNRARRLVY